MTETRQAPNAISGHPEQPSLSRCRLLLAVAIAPVLLLTGCGTVLWETDLDNQVYFNNTTNEVLELRLKHSFDPKEPVLWTIKPNQMTTLPLVFRNECGDRWLITDEKGTIVKDPGKICWHDTVTIP